jgi:hypothetical protein
MLLLIPRGHTTPSTLIFCSIGSQKSNSYLSTFPPIPCAFFSELCVQSMNIGLGQIIGFNYKRVGVPSSEAMLYSPTEEMSKR